MIRRAIGLIDLTDLSEESTEAQVVQLCERAERHRTAAVCVWPEFVAVAAEQLSGTGLGVATVVNFPTGDERPFAVDLVTERVLDDGATEVDVVLPYRSWLAGDRDRATEIITQVRHRTGEAGALMKVILETGALADPAVIRSAAQFAVDQGADFVKTSTGKIPVSATPEAVTVMLEVIARSSRRVGIKPSGGIGTSAAALDYLDLAASALGPEWISPSTFRFGASGLLSALLTESGEAEDEAHRQAGY
jgi:deoxyribose-phosphate aldolase